MQYPRQPINSQPQLTGEGFKGEKALAVIAVALTIISTLLLIDLTIKQRKHIKMQADKFKKDNGID